MNLSCEIQTQLCLVFTRTAKYRTLSTTYTYNSRTKKLFWTEKNRSLPQVCGMRNSELNAIDVVEKLNESVESRNQWKFNDVSKKREEGWNRSGWSVYKKVSKHLILGSICSMADKRCFRNSRNLLRSYNWTIDTI